MAQKAAKPIADGFHTIVPHLVCRDAASAIDFYKCAFGAVELMRMPLPDGTLMHAAIRIGDLPVLNASTQFMRLTSDIPPWIVARTPLA